MKILIIADFRLDSPRFLLNSPRRFAKGFVRNGHDVKEFSYRDTLLGLSPVKSKKWALKLAKKKTDHLLTQLARNYQPDIIFIAAFKLLDAATISQLKEILPGVLVMCWYGDMYDGVDPKIAPLARLCEWFLATSGGSLLQAYKQLGIKHCAFIPNPSDKDIEHPREVPDNWRSNILFTGKLKHGQHGQDSLRWNLIKHLVEKKGMTTYGCMSQPTIHGLDYLNAICGAKIALSINAFNDIRFYHSDRLTNYLACGTFVLAKHIPDSELLFENNKHLCYFDTFDECIELVDKFLTDEKQRRQIARAGMKLIHEDFSCEKLARYIIDLAQTGSYNPPWAQIL